MNINGACIDCYGTGSKKEKDMIGTVRMVRCQKCYGRGATPMKYGSGEHRVAANVVALRESGQL